MITLSDNLKKIYGEFAFDVLSGLVGGDAKAYFQSEQTMALAWADCHSNAQIHNLVGLYLAGSSERAEHNLNRLNEYLREHFQLSV